jgi:Tol biopolymer transport system component
MELTDPADVFNYGNITFTPDGREIVAVKSRGGFRELLLVPVEGGTFRRSNFTKGTFTVRLSPDGKTVAFWDMHRPHEDIWTLENFLPLR